MAERPLGLPKRHLPSRTPEQTTQRQSSRLENPASERRLIRRKTMFIRHTVILGIASLATAGSIIAAKDREILPTEQSPFQTQSEATSQVSDLINVPGFSLSEDKIIRENFPRFNRQRYFENYTGTLDWMQNSQDVAISSIPHRLLPHIWTSDEKRTDGAYAQVDIVKVDDTTGQKALKIVLFVRSFDKPMTKDELFEAAKQLFYETIILEQALKNPLKFATDAAYRDKLQREIQSLPFSSFPTNEQLTH
ncbi:hypothetical protein HYZ70_00130 [Candidatus Curtissbacteria bacterium]|nr:hypothetical protein [Candidatus Curtissbacteria bacterium]